MRIVRFSVGGGAPKLGVQKGDTFIDISEAVGTSSTKTFLADDSLMAKAVSAAADGSAAPRHAAADVKLLVCVCGYISGILSLCSVFSVVCVVLSIPSLCCLCIVFLSALILVLCVFPSPSVVS